MSYTRIIDTRVDSSTKENFSYLVKEGAQSVSFVPITSSSHSTQNTQFQLNNIADMVSRDRRMELEMSVSFTLNVTQTTGLPIDLFDGVGSVLGLKQYPLNRCVQNCTHQINQASYSLNTSQIIDGIAHQRMDELDSNFYDNTQPEVVHSYANSVGTPLSPIGSYSQTNNGTGIYKPRSLGIVVTNNTVPSGAPWNLGVTVNLVEPLISPFNNIGKKNVHGLFAITGENIALQWVSDLWNNMMAWSGNPAFTVNSITTAFQPTATLRCVYITPYPDFFNEVPRQSITHYNNYSVFTQSVANLNSGASTQISTPVCNFTNMPNKILIYIKDHATNPLATVADRYALITNISCVLDNGQPTLTTCSPNQLWELSTANGLTQPRSSFTQSLLSGVSATPIYGNGSILVLDPAINLSISNPQVTDGTPGRYIFQATIALQNATNENFTDLSLYVVAVNDAILERNGSEYRNYLLSLPYDAREKAGANNSMNYDEFIELTDNNLFISGGSWKSFWRGAKKVGKTVYDVGKKIYEKRDEIKDVLQKLKAMKGKGSTLEEELADRSNKRVDLFYN